MIQRPNSPLSLSPSFSTSRVHISYAHPRARARPDAHFYSDLTLGVKKFWTRHASSCIRSLIYDSGGNVHVFICLYWCSMDIYQQVAFLSNCKNFHHYQKSQFLCMLGTVSIILGYWLPAKQNPSVSLGTCNIQYPLQIWWNSILRDDIILSWSMEHLVDINAITDIHTREVSESGKKRRLLRAGKSIKLEDRETRLLPCSTVVGRIRMMSWLSSTNRPTTYT